MLLAPFAVSEAPGALEVILIVALVAAVVAIRALLFLTRWNDLKEARIEYQWALEELKHDPSVEARQTALACGRKLMGIIETMEKMRYAPLPKITEMTIQNDLQAAERGERIEENPTTKRNRPLSPADDEDE
jgi:hypothetical protein